MTVTQSETTKTDSPKDSGFYSGITIEGFRQFKKLELTNLGKVNLVLGPNNAGKTSILEAVYIHACHGNIKLIFDNFQKFNNELKYNFEINDFKYQEFFNFINSGGVIIDSPYIPFNNFLLKSFDKLDNFL